ncbi:MAG: hypothetical protein RL242_3432 [Pseudomonadota bacterium]
MFFGLDIIYMQTDYTSPRIDLNPKQYRFGTSPKLLGMLLETKKESLMLKKFVMMGVATLISLGLSVEPSKAQTLKIGSTSEASSADPHFHNLGPNNALRRHIFQSLVGTDTSQRLTPLLAESWKATDENTWEFKLRKNVKFHDGSDFTAQDVIYTVCRIPTVVDSPSSFTVYTKAIQGMQAPNPHTLIVKTATPYPLLPTELSTWGIISAAANGGQSAKFNKEGCSDMGTPPSSDAFNSAGPAAVGTGPFKLVSYIRGESTTLARNDNYWGTKSEWAEVIIRPITSEGPRVAALLAGDVDLIESPPLQDLERINSTAGFEVVQGLSNRVIYLHLDTHADDTPGIKGVPAGKNPLKDRRVREALSKAINRDAIVARIMGGVAVAAGQLLPEGFFGSTPGLKADQFDPDRAKALLAEAGYPNGFELVIGSPNDRYINDEKVAQAMAQMLTRIGIKTSVDATTASTFFSRRNKYEFSAYMAGWGAGTGEMSSPLKALVATRNTDKGMGGTNRGRYSNPKMDALLEQALRTVDDSAREKLLQEASAVVLGDYGILPLHFEVTPWAYRSGVSYAPRADQYTLAFEVKSTN